MWQYERRSLTVLTVFLHAYIERKNEPQFQRKFTNGATAIFKDNFRIFSFQYLQKKTNKHYLVMHFFF